MTPKDVLDFAIRPACQMLFDVTIGSTRALAEVQLIAIGHQESRLQCRRQRGGGPARGFWQFEVGGVHGVRRHKATRDRVTAVFKRLDYATSLTDIETKQILEHNDILAASFARLLLYTLPAPLPTTADEGWRQYLDAWRPGKPHPSTWAAAWQVGLDTVAP